MSTKQNLERLLNHRKALVEAYKKLPKEDTERRSLLLAGLLNVKRDISNEKYSFDKWVHASSKFRVGQKVRYTGQVLVDNREELTVTRIRKFGNANESYCKLFTINKQTRSQLEAAERHFELMA